MHNIVDNNSQQYTDTVGNLLMIKQVCFCGTDIQREKMPPAAVKENQDFTHKQSLTYDYILEN